MKTIGKYKMDTMNNFEVKGALERMKMIKRGAPLSTLWPSDIDIILNALEKQTSKKILNRNRCTYGFFGICPNYKNIIENNRSFKLCEECGQAIDWSEEGEE